ncbi:MULTISPECIES: SGNH/GDSL hydrolase family protein [Thermocrispum]|jgi:lysophospholipase L1-like esterase|uniref:SGNH/GDSL hydrolase family protein n=1 Tax=Thermocrispum agreste TaxID=37925 RepID=A0ABD6FL94_9PSEU|nr:MULTISPECIES: SGNH/GDSL hydrolase family protein [Thermocrispum]
MHRFTSFMALGDSFTEGMNDELPDGTFRGWADRVAEMLAKDNPGFSYANLAIRGKTLRQIIDEQLPVALEARPDLVTVCAGGNDIIKPGSNVDLVAEMFDGMIRQLVEAGIDVLMFTGPDPRQVSVVNRLRGKVALYNAHLHAIAQKYRTRVVDLWAMDVLRDPRAFSEDRLHFSPEAHRRIALRVAEELGLPVEEDWREPWPKPARRRDWLRARRDDLVWARTHFWPWLVRQIRGVSTGDGLQPKRPKLMPLKPPAQLTGDSEMVNAAG